MAKPQSKRAYNPFAELAHVREEKAANHSDPQELKLSDTQTLDRSRAKSQNPAFVKLTAYVPKELHRTTKARLVQQDREISELVEELLTDWLQNGTGSEARK